MQLLLPKQPGGLLTLSELAHCTAPATSVKSADDGHGTNEKEIYSYMMEQSAASSGLISHCQ